MVGRTGTSRTLPGERVVSRRDPVWITGVGAVTPLGHSFACITDQVLAGRSGVGTVTGFDVSEHPSQIAAQIDGIPCPPGWSPQAFGQLHRLEQLILSCCSAALRDADWFERRQEVRIG